MKVIDLGKDSEGKYKMGNQEDMFLKFQNIEKGLDLEDKEAIAIAFEHRKKEPTRKKLTVHTKKENEKWEKI